MKIIATVNGVIALDGKTVRHAFDKSLEKFANGEPQFETINKIVDAFGGYRAIIGH